MKRRTRTLMLAACLLAGTPTVIPVKAERGDVSYYELPQPTTARAMVAAPDGSLWLAGEPRFNIIIVTPDGDVTEFLAGPGTGDTPNGMVVGPDGNIWIVEFEFARVLRVTADHEVTVFQLPGHGHARSIAAGPDGNLWVTGNVSVSIIYRVTPEGQATEFPLPESMGLADHIIAGPDGRMWFTVSTGQRIGAIAMDGTIDEIEVPLPPSANMTLGSDGNVWFGADGGRVVRLTAEGDATEFSLPSQIHSIVAGADGALWASAPFAAEILSISTTGEIEVFGSLPNDARRPLAAGADGSIWFLDGGQVGRLDSGYPAAAAKSVQRARARH